MGQVKVLSRDFHYNTKDDSPPEVVKNHFEHHKVPRKAPSLITHVIFEWKEYISGKCEKIS